MRLSVLVCTRNRAHAIIPCLDSISEALDRAAPIDAEIVVVDNGSTDNTRVIIQEWAANRRYPVNLQVELKTGVSRARNRGLMVARGDLLIFTDDDCRLDPGHIATAIRLDSADDKLVLRGGRVELGDPADLPLTILTGVTPIRWSRDARSARHGSIHNTVLGCNIALRRALACKIGLFDERFGPGANIPGADDCDYVQRAYLVGATIEYAPDMLVYHFHGRKTVEAGQKLLRGYLVGGGALYAKFLFQHLDFVRPAYWDLKTALKELFSGTSRHQSGVGYSHRKILVYNALGFMRYYAVTLQKAFQRRCRASPVSLPSLSKTVDVR